MCNSSRSFKLRAEKSLLQQDIHILRDTDIVQTNQKRGPDWESAYCLINTYFLWKTFESICRPKFQFFVPIVIKF